MTTLALHYGQSQIFADLFLHKTVVNAVGVCARGFGKSHLAAVSAIQAVFELIQLREEVPNKNVYIIAPTYDQVTDIYFPLLMYQLGMERYVIKSSKDGGALWFPRDVNLRLVSYEAVARLRGKGAYFVVNDEVRDWTKGIGFKEAWEGIIQPCITTRWGAKRARQLGAPSQGRSLTISTPKGYDYLYDMYNRQEQDSAWKSYHFDYTQSPLLDQEETEQIKHTIDPLRWAREYMASFEESGNTVFYCFKRKEHVKSDLPDWSRDKDGRIDETVHIAIDFNVMIQASSAWAIRGGQAHCLDEFKGAADTQQLADAIKGRFWPNGNKGCKIIVYPDPSGNSRKTSAVVGVTDFSILRNNGFELRAHAKAPGMVDSVACVNRMFKTAAGETNMYISSKCQGVITSLERTSWVDNNADTAVIDKKEGIEHYSDGIRYFTEYMFPIRTGTKTVIRGFSF
jgi:hypothetical protein